MDGENRWSWSGSLQGTVEVIGIEDELDSPPRRLRPPPRPRPLYARARDVPLTRHAAAECQGSGECLCRVVARESATGGSGPASNGRGYGILQGGQGGQE